jgi:hypothetical protein
MATNMILAGGIAAMLISGIVGLEGAVNNQSFSGATAMSGAQKNIASLEHWENSTSGQKQVGPEASPFFNMGSGQASASTSPAVVGKTSLDGSTVTAYNNGTYEVCNSMGCQTVSLNGNNSRNQYSAFDEMVARVAQSRLAQTTTDSYSAYSNGVQADFGNPANSATALNNLAYGPQPYSAQGNGIQTIMSQYGNSTGNMIFAGSPAADYQPYSAYGNGGQTIMSQYGNVAGNMTDIGTESNGSASNQASTGKNSVNSGTSSPAQPWAW